MRSHVILRFLAGLSLAAVPLTASAGDGSITLSDPAGDDNGPGAYKYPTDPVYTKGSFDLRKLEITDKGDKVEFKVTVGARVEDPWNSKDWDGNGFSLQFPQIYIDTDHAAGKGFTDALPGLGSLKWADDEAWDKVVLLSPQGRARLSAELRKTGDKKSAAVIPTVTRASGSSIIATVKKSDLGSTPVSSWGFQVAMQSNEGYPDKADLLSRPVNETGGQHRFGGGSDGDCDPQVLDIFAGKAKGEAAEVGEQHAALAYKCGSKVAHMPMIYPGK